MILLSFIRPLFLAINRVFSISPIRRASNSRYDKSFATYEATVNHGLEDVAKREILKKLGVEARDMRGRVIFRSNSCIDDLLKLRSINNLFLTIFDKTYTYDEMPVDEESLEKLLIKIADECEWQTGLEKWSEMSKFQCDIEKLLTNDENLKSMQPKFRISSKRHGDDHKFASPDICRIFGSVVNTKFGWPIKLKNSDLDIYCNVTGNRFYANITLSPTCLSYRNIKRPGLTTLKAAISYAMLEKAQIRVGDIVLDPMTGSGSIPLECCSTWLDGEFYGFALGGEKQKKPMDIYKVNLASFVRNGGPPVDILKLDATNMPFCDDSIDVIISDLPFGKRHGSKKHNERLYPALLRDMARVSRRGTGRAVLLTHDHKNMKEAYKQNVDYWLEISDDSVQVGTFDCFIYLFKRTNLAFDAIKV